ncbi:MAG: permease-like cell division protein FtsX [Clostridia bacterium]|nr:permease-like cell division protein FtsX [Clostridia bacterium]
MFNNFKYLVREGFRNAWANRLMTFASVGVLVCCLVLMGSAVLVSVNISHIMELFEDKNVVMVFLNDTVSGSDATLTVADVQKKILTVDNVDPDNIEFVPKEKGFSTLMNRFDEKLKIIDTLGDTANILPDAFKVGFKDPTRYETTVQQLKNLPEVYTVRDNREYAEKLMGINQTVTVVGTWIVGLLLVVSLFIITNTIKLTMYVRKLEISIMKSVGATDWFIRMPFLVEGIVIGLTAGLISFGLVSYIYSAAASSITDVLATGVLPYSSMLFKLLLAFIGSGVLSGSIGSLVSIRKYLRNDGGLYDE